MATSTTRPSSAASKRLLKELAPLLSTRAFGLAERVLGEALAEDLSLLSPDTISALINEIAAGLTGHENGKSVIRTQALDNGDAIFVAINDDMPFLFDSIMGEVNEHPGQVALVVHPVASVQHDGTNFEISDGLRRSLDAPEAVATSIIGCVLHGADAATLKTIKAGAAKTAKQVRAAVRDWKPMLTRVDAAVDELRDGVTPARKTDVEEAIAFLDWLRDDNFTFLGIREYDFSGGQARGKLQRSDTPSLGILSDPDFRILRRGDEAFTTTPQIRAFLNSRDLLIVTKANTKSNVHRRTYLDYIGIKRYDAKGKLKGELRLIGLFTSTAYTRSVKNIPYVRSKATAVLAKSHHAANSHSGKALLNALETYPRDELFQISPTDLARHAEAIVALHDRPRVRVLSRPDPFDRFVSVIVFVPRERYSSEARENICTYLAGEYDGRVSAYYPAFPEG
ncbi:MAG: NAD-glutamate dehydrogenase, partial [Pseudomonadota bacterium]